MNGVPFDQRRDHLSAAFTIQLVHKQSQTTAEICDALKRGGLHSTAKDYFANVYTILVRQEKLVGDIVRVEKKWGLVEWFPNYRKRLPKDTPKEPTGSESAKRSGKATDSLRDQSKRVLSNAGKAMKAVEIAAVLEVNGEKVNFGSLQAALSAMAKHGVIQRAGTGLYRALKE